MGQSREKREEILWDTHQQAEEINPIELSGEIAPDLFGIEPVKAKEMISGLTTVFAEREVLKEAYIDVISLPVTTENLPTFKELRLKIVKNRTQGIEKWHKINKAFYLAGGRFVDAIKNKEVLENEQMESKLLEAEKYFENIEKERLQQLKNYREQVLQPFVETLPNDLETLDQDVFDSFLETKKKAFAEKLEFEKAEAIRIENERIEREKQIEAQRLENERLKKEAAEKDALLKKERESRELLEAENRKKEQAEKNTELLAKLEAEKLAKAPIKKQLTAWVSHFELPTKPEHGLALDIEEKFESFKKWAYAEINKI